MKALFEIEVSTANTEHSKNNNNYNKKKNNMFRR